MHPLSRHTIFTFAFVLWTTSCLFVHTGVISAQPAWTGEFHHMTGLTLTGTPQMQPGVQRVTLAPDYRFDGGRLHVRADIRNRFEAAPDSLEWVLPEVWLDLYFSSIDLRLGRIPLQPGLSPFGAPINRIQPLDLRTFFLEPTSTLRRGTIAAELSYYFRSSRLRALFSPTATPSLLPAPDSRWFAQVPLPDGIPVRLDAPAQQTRISDVPQGGLLWDSRHWRTVEMQIGILYWTPSSPAYSKEIQIFTPGTILINPEVILTETHTPAWILTGGIIWEASSSVILLSEAAWFSDRTYDRIQQELLSFDPDEPDLISLPLILQITNEEENGFLSTHSALDLLQEVRLSPSWTSFILQWNAHFIVDPHPDVVQDTWFHTASVSALRDFFRQRLNSEIMILYQLNGQDFWIQTRHTYDVMDNVNLSLGAHLFGGPEPGTNYGHLSFGSYRSNSLIYAGLRFTF